VDKRREKKGMGESKGNLVVGGWVDGGMEGPDRRRRKKVDLN
jgi:hypothetical protein